MRLSLKKTKSMVVSQSRTVAPGYGDLTLGGVELEEVKSLRILVLTLDCKLTFEIPLCKVLSVAARGLGFVGGAGKLFDCNRVLKSCFNVYVLQA